MNLYKVTRPDHIGYDEFYGMICAAETEEDARNIHPKWEWDQEDGREVDTTDWSEYTWVERDKTHLLVVEHIGFALPGTKSGTIILTDFNAG